MDPGDRILLSDGVIVLAAGEVVRGEVVSQLLPIEVTLLQYLALHPGTAVSVEALHRDVWGFAPQVRSRAAYFAVRKLRGRLEPDPQRPTVLVGTERKGFQLRAPVERATTNLDRRRASFVGREDELTAIAAGLGVGRVVSLVGPGGAGKTRTAARFGETSAEAFSGGVWFCDLAEARTAADLVAAVAHTLGVPAVGRSLDATRDQVGQALAARGRVLVILDNVEQVADAAGPLVSRWSTDAPEARVLVTTRERLRIDGEQVVRLGPLPPRDAAVLFTDRARAIGGTLDPDAPLDALVKLLDGLPLALELAAARASTLSVTQIVAHLDDRFALLSLGAADAPARHSTLEAALTWSWDLLSAHEKELLAQLSVFRGGFTLAAAEAVASRRPGSPWVVDVLQALVDQSLVVRTSDTRFDLLLTVQDFASRKLVDRDLAERRHGEWSAAFCESLRRGVRLIVTPRHLVELDNVLAAATRALDRGDASVARPTVLVAVEGLLHVGPVSRALELVRAADPAAIGPAALQFCEARLLTVCGLPGAAEASRAALDQARAGQDRGLEVRAAVLWCTALLAQGRADEGRALMEHALSLARALGDPSLEGTTLRGLAGEAQRRGALDEARRYYDRALRCAEADEDPRHRAIVLTSIAQVAVDIGHLERAQREVERAIDHARAAEDHLIVARATCIRGELARITGRFADAERELEACAALARRIGDRATAAYAAATLGNVLRDTGDLRRARGALEAAAGQMAHQSRSGLGAVWSDLAALDLEEGDPVAALDRLDEGAELLAGGGHVVELGKLRARQARAYVATGDRAAAERAVAEATAIAERIGALGSSEVAREIDRARRALA